MTTKTLRRDFLLGSAAAGLMAAAPSRLGARSLEPASARRAGVWNVRDYGARGDGQQMDTQAIHAAIAACASAGGGTVWFPAGKYLTGAVRLENNTNLHLDAGATILGSQDPKDYPVYPSPWPDGTRQISSLIYGENLTNVSLTGRGVIDGQGRAWWERLWLAHHRRGFPIPPLSEEQQREEIAKIKFGRPRLIRLIGCRNVLIEGLTLTHSPAWTIHPLFCESVTIHGVTILNPVPSPNTDGIDPESSRNVHISDCHIDVGDDCIAIKAGKNAIGRQVGKPCENITITNLTTRHGHGGVSIGSEMSGDVRNVAISNCVFQGTDRGIRIKTKRGRGGIVEGVTASNIVMQDVPEAFYFTMYYGHAGGLNQKEPINAGTPRFRDFHMSNITARGARVAGEVLGLAEMPIQEVTFSNIEIEADKGFFCQNAHHLGFYDVQIETASGPSLSTKRVRDLELDGFRCDRPHAGTPVIELEDTQDVFARGCQAAAGTSVFIEARGKTTSGIILRGNHLDRAAKPVEFTEGASPAALSEK